MRAAKDSAPSMPAVARGVRARRRTTSREFYRWFAATPRTVTAFSQGVNQSSSGTDKVNAIINVHLATGPHRQAGRGAVLAHRPAERDGRARGRRARESARRAHGFRDPSTSTACSDSGTRRPSRRSAGLKAVDLFDAIDEGAIKAVWIMAHQSRRQHAGRRPGAPRARALRARRGVGLRARHRHDGVRARAAAGGRLGREGRHGHELRAAHLAAARVPARAGRGRPDWWIVDRGRAAHGLRRRLRLSRRRPRSFASTRGSRRSRTMARARSTSAHWPSIGDADYDALAPVQWPLPARREQARTRLFADGRFFTPDGKARFVATRAARAGAAPTADFPLVLNTGRVRDQWHTMTRTGQVAAAHGPPPGAVRATRTPPTRSAAASRPAISRKSSSARRASALRASKSRTDVRAGHRVRADALERAVRERRARRRVDRRGHRSRLGPARAQAHARARAPLCAGVVRLRAVARRRSTHATARISPALAATASGVTSSRANSLPASWPEWADAVLGPRAERSRAARPRRRPLPRRAPRGRAVAGVSVRRADKAAAVAHLARRFVRARCAR